MTTREEIENRLGIFARRALFDNCGIGPDGFQPGNDCGGKPGSGGSESKDAPAKKAAPTSKRQKSKPTREWKPEKKHGIKLPANPRRLNIDEQQAALKQMGYSVSDTQSAPGPDGRFVTTELLRYPDGKTERVSVADLTALVYAGQSSPGGKAAKPSDGVKGIEERAKAAGKTFTEQWLEETRGAIDRDYETRERREKSAEKRKADATTKRAEEIERRISELQAQGPQPAAAQSPRMAEISGNIAALEARLAETNKIRDEARARADAIAEERKALEGNIAESKRRLEESKARSRALSRALRGL